jgi:hypothetical protein
MSCTCAVPTGHCYGCAPAAFGFAAGPAGDPYRAAVRGFVLGAVTGAVLGGPMGLFIGGGLSAALNGLFGDALDRKLRAA